MSTLYPETMLAKTLVTSIEIILKIPFWGKSGILDYV